VIALSVYGLDGMSAIRSLVQLSGKEAVAFAESFFAEAKESLSLH
jgi:hypothetical protein